MAPLRASSSEFSIDATGWLQNRGEAVLQAIQTGQLDAVTGNAYLNALSEQDRIKEHTELETRLKVALSIQRLEPKPADFCRMR